VEDTRLYKVLEGPVVGAQLDKIRDAATVSDARSMREVLSRVLRFLRKVACHSAACKGPENPQILQDPSPLARPGEGGDGFEDRRVLDDLRHPAPLRSNAPPYGRHKTQYTLRDYMPGPIWSLPEARSVPAGPSRVADRHPGHLQCTTVPTATGTAFARCTGGAVVGAAPSLAEAAACTVPAVCWCLLVSALAAGTPGSRHVACRAFWATASAAVSGTPPAGCAYPM
jgi:hypothetical protein